MQATSGVIYLDADACPVKDQVYRVAARYEIPVWVVANSPMRIPEMANLKVRLIVVPGTPDAADTWIAERAVPGDLVLTADIPLAAQTVEHGVRTLDFRGKEFHPASVGNALAARDINALLRSMGELTRGPAPITQRDRGQFASLLDNVVSAMSRARPGSPSPEH
ncbi:MAG: YaiI/YqxD family protein [Thermomicrobiales bacterium]